MDKFKIPLRVSHGMALEIDKPFLTRIRDIESDIQTFGVGRTRGPFERPFDFAIGIEDNVGVRRQKINRNNLEAIRSGCGDGIHVQFRRE